MKTVKTYRELKEELDAILEELQNPDTDLDEALALHKTGKQLLSQLEEYLKEAELKIQKATKG